MSARGRGQRARQMRQLKSQTRYGQGSLAFGTLSAVAKLSVGAAPVATGSVDYLVNRVAYSGTMTGTPSTMPFMWAFMKKTDTGETLIDLSVEDDVLDAIAEKKLYHVKGPTVWANVGAQPPRLNGKLTNIPMRSGDELHFYFQNVGSSAFTTGMQYRWVGWLSYQV